MKDRTVVFAEPHCPRTMMILGAALAGGDALKLAERMVEQDERELKDDSDPDRQG